MSMSVKYQEAIGKNGFPKQVGSFESVFALLVTEGKKLLEAQPRVVSGLAKPVAAKYVDMISLKNCFGRHVNSEQRIFSEIQKSLPNQLPGLRGLDDNIGILSDVGHHWKNRHHVCNWVIDPLVGVDSYISGEKDWGISLAFMVGDKATGGVIYYPAQKMAYFTCEDGQSYQRVFGEGDVTASHRLTPDMLTGQLGLAFERSASVSGVKKSAAIFTNPARAAIRAAAGENIPAYEHP